MLCVCDEGLCVWILACIVCGVCVMGSVWLCVYVYYVWMRVYCVMCVRDVRCVCV